MKHYTDLGQILGCRLAKLNFLYADQSDENLLAEPMKNTQLPDLMAEFVEGSNSNCGWAFSNSDNAQKLVLELQQFANQFCHGSQVVRQSFPMPDGKFGILEAVPSKLRF